MEFEFDKEIDAILRKARAGEVATSPGTHMDADEISAFAENALTDAARMRFTAHLADCTRCRKILSNTILLNSEAETETASSAVSAPVTEAKTPWYRKFLAFPQLAYTMGAMVLLFSGFFGYLILKNLPTADRAVSYSTENKALPERPAALAPSNTAANSNATADSSVPSTATAPSNAASTANSAPVSASNTNATTAATPAAEKRDASPLNQPVPVPQATVMPDVKTQDQPRAAEEQTKLAKTAPMSPTAGTVTENRAKEEKRKNDKDAAVSEDDESKSADQNFRLESKPMPKIAKKQPSNAGAARTVGGKTFNNVGGIWFDTAVGKQKTKTVKRGTSEYLRLDAGLRSIADSLGGTVVVLWNGKAYRIQ